MGIVFSKVCFSRALFVLYALVPSVNDGPYKGKEDEIRLAGLCSAPITGLGWEVKFPPIKRNLKCRLEWKF